MSRIALTVAGAATAAGMTAIVALASNPTVRLTAASIVTVLVTVAVGALLVSARHDPYRRDPRRGTAGPVRADRHATDA